MDVVNLGRTGLRVSRACLGTMTFGRQADEAEAQRIVDRALDAGVTFVDTADAYPIPPDLATNGLTEEILGRVLGSRRDEVVLASKCHIAMGPAPHQQGNSRLHIRRSIEASLRRLGTDRIDLYQVHQEDPLTPLEETLSTLDDLQREGKIVQYGACNSHPATIAEAAVAAAAVGVEGFTCEQPRYNLLHRHCEHAVFPIAERLGLGVIPFNPLAGGFLTGKHRALSAGDAPPEGRFSMPGVSGPLYRDRYWTDEVFAKAERVFALCDEAGLAPARVAVGWVLAQPAVTAPILGASRAEQLDDVLPAFEEPLDPALVAALDEATTDDALAYRK